MVITVLDYYYSMELFILNHHQYHEFIDFDHQLASYLIHYDCHLHPRNHHCYPKEDLHLHKNRFTLNKLFGWFIHA